MNELYYQIGGIAVMAMLASFTLTNSVKLWRKEHGVKLPMPKSDIRLMAGLFTLVFTLVGWTVFGAYNDNFTRYDVAVSVGTIAGVLTPFVWQNWIKVLRMIKPEWADRINKGGK